MSVRADYSRLPKDWWQDPLIAEMTYQRIGQMIQSGSTQAETARAVGCSERAISRYSQRAARKRVPKPPFGNAKLHEEAVRTIRDRHDAGVTQSALAREYGVAKTTVRRVVVYESWSEVA